MQNHVFRRSISMALLACLATASVGYAVAGLAADHATQHSHDLSHHAPAELNPGKQPWATDAALREGMGRIRDAVAQTLASSGEARLTQGAATALARSIDDDVAFLVAHCTLTPQADAALHVMLARLQHGAQALRTDPASPDAISGIHGVLQDYPRYFSHPGWVPLQAPH